ncbi:type II toxin-antitoxin system HicB family antitoxin [candidate division KSB1 bacterium]|nr:type II toxin-antitoxin system HicB family antitoxin [candidate division KSB1 bacterium]
MKLKIIIEKDDSGYFTAEVPALPGCFSQGETIDEAKKNIREAISGWMEVMNNKVLSREKNILETYEDLV